MRTVSPASLVQRHLDSILSCLNGVFDGDAESVHQARIATRRMREVLPLVKAPSQVADVVKAAGRQLGRVRELDVMGSQLGSLGTRIPLEAATELIAALRVVRDREHTARRDMAKALEGLDLPALRDVPLRGHGRLWNWLPHRHSATRRSVDEAWNRISVRSQEAIEAVHRAHGIYFPNRMHRTRVAVKKLRYAVEAAADMGLWRPDRLLKDLRSIQSTLGELHDTQVLVDLLAELAPSETTAPKTSVKDVLDDDIARHHAQYMRRRDRVLRIADHCIQATARHRRRWRIPAAVVAASLLAAPVIVESASAGRKERDVAAV